MQTQNCSNFNLVNGGGGHQNAVSDRSIFPSPPTPFWLKAKSYQVTTSLHAKLAALPDREARNLAYAQDIIVYLSKKQRNPAFFVNIGARYFNDGLGENYRKYINQLVSIGELEVNEHYQESTDSTQGFTKSYRIPAQARATGTTWARFNAKRLRKKADHSTAQGTVADWIIACCQQLEARDIAPRQQLSAKALDGLAKVHSGAVNLVKGRVVNRLYHTIVEMPKEGRKFIRHKGKRELAEFDLKACHPWLLGTFTTDAEERARYYSLLESADIYISARDWAGHVNRSRDDVKEDFMRFCNGAMENYFFDYYQAHFPGIAKRVQDIGRAGMASTLQNLEAKLMVEMVGSECAKRGLFYVPMHDGWLGLVAERYAVSQIVRDAAKSLVGYLPVITMERMTLNASKEVVPPIDNNNNNSSTSLSSQGSSYVQDKNIRVTASSVRSKWTGELRLGLRLAGLEKLAQKYASG